MNKKKILEEILLWKNIGTMIECNVPFLTSLNLVKDSFPVYARELEGMAKDINEGGTFSEVMSKYRESFHPRMYSFMRIGEQIGAVPEMISKGIELMQKDIQYEIHLEPQFLFSFDFPKSVLFRSLALYLEAGLPIVKSFQLAAKDPILEKMQENIKYTCDGLINGKTLSEMMKEQSEIYNGIDVALVEKGESLGTLEVTMKKLADLAEEKFYLSEIH